MTVGDAFMNSQTVIEAGIFINNIRAGEADAREIFNKAVGNSNTNASLTFANLLNATVGDFTVALGQTIPAFKEGRNKEGAAGLVQMISSLTPMMGAVGGPAGGAVGGLISLALGIVSSILGAFEDARKSLASEIKDELSHLHAQLVHDELVAAMGDLERAYGPMQEVADKTRTWEQMQSGWINMFEGNATRQLNLTRSWLEKAEESEQRRMADDFRLLLACGRSSSTRLCGHGHEAHGRRSPENWSIGA